MRELRDFVFYTGYLGLQKKKELPEKIIFEEFHDGLNADLDLCSVSALWCFNVLVLFSLMSYKTLGRGVLPVLLCWSSPLHNIWCFCPKSEWPTSQVQWKRRNYKTGSSISTGGLGKEFAFSLPLCDKLNGCKFSMCTEKYGVRSWLSQQMRT